MARDYFQKKNLNIIDKILAFDFMLLFLILLLGAISLLAMYSSERGNFSYHTQGQLYRFFTFFLFFIVGAVLVYFADYKAEIKQMKYRAAYHPAMRRVPVHHPAMRRGAMPMHH